MDALPNQPVIIFEKAAPNGGPGKPFLRGRGKAFLQNMKTSVIHRKIAP
jgi:hypothetical protein